MPQTLGDLWLSSSMATEFRSTGQVGCLDPRRSCSHCGNRSLRHFAKGPICFGCPKKSSTAVSARGPCMRVRRKREAWRSCRRRTDVGNRRKRDDSAMDSDGKATRIQLFNFSTPQMRAFHMSWMAFFLCFFAWFGIAPLMAVVPKSSTHQGSGRLVHHRFGDRDDLCALLVGWLCDRVGPRITYSCLLVIGSLPVMAIGLAHDFAPFWSYAC